MPDRPAPRWNPDTQSWETGPSRPVRPYTGPLPPRPTTTPSVGAPSADGTASDAGAAPPPDVPWPPFASSGTPAPPPEGPAFPPAPEAPFPPSPPSPPFPPASEVPFPPFPPAPGAGRRTKALIAAAVVAVLAIGAGGAYLLWGRTPNRPPAAHPPTASVTSTPTAPATGGTAPGMPTVSPTTSPTASGVPGGYHLVHDAKGFTLAVPDGWQRDERSTGVFYTSADSRNLLQIFQITEPNLTPQQALQQASQGLAGNPGYRQLSLGPLSGPPGPSGAQLVYAYDSDRLGIRVQAVDTAFTVADGRQFAVLVLGPAADWPRQQETERMALRSFAPTSAPTS
ncbi:hypothetical protein [Streptomyces sp. CT34]|uniref:hypothetical protein n=1 Tax=Streptomyces sp. CT34 TaxID=1553907 RepID=UPI0005BCE812|nr:hypothetical protein [Streptomyces sp. CT34]